MQASHRLSEMLSKARKRDRQPLWIGNDDWATLKAYWGTAEYQILSARNKRNRASEKGGSMHTGGSISQAQYAYRLVRICLTLSLIVIIYLYLLTIYVSVAFRERSWGERCKCTSCIATPTLRRQPGSMLTRGRGRLG